MATIYKWTPFGVALDITASAGTVTRISATQFTVTINTSWETYYSGAKTNYGMIASSGGNSVTLNPFGTNASSGSGSFTGTYSINTNGSATKSIAVTFRNFNNDNGDSATKTVSFNVTVPAWTSYTISYNANGGSGAPGRQTKWKNQTLVLSSTKPTRTGYTFLGWSTSSGATSATYSAGGDYTANTAATLYAVWRAYTYTVSYNANGGTGAPGNQTKTYGVTLSLSTETPIRTNYNFKGWGTSASATTVSYVAGASYTNNAAITLYAIWELAYTKPRITDFIVERCTSDGMISDEGTYAKVIFGWATDKEVSSIVIKRKSASETAWASTTITASGTSGSVSTIIGSGGLEIDTSYTVAVTVTDSLDSNTATKTLPNKFYTVDFNDNGTGVSFGGSADVDNTFKNNFDLLQVGNRYTYQPIAFNGETGYTLLATVQVTSLNANTPITFVLSKRDTLCPMTVHARFASSSSTTDPDLASFVYEGDNFGAFFAKTAESTWNLYVDNLSGWSNPCVQDWYTSQSNASRINVTFPSEQVTELPEPWYRATPAKLQGILDFIYPVGSVYISYSHNDPATMFGGTWVRIENAFLWGCDENGGIGTTGGEKTHTLTVNELPTHTHTVAVANTASGSNAASNMARYNSNASSYIGSVVSTSTGGGAAHNNMPPYIQVSIWRRTA